MNNTLSIFVHGRDNNFNLIRFVAAYLVLVSHCFPLYDGSGKDEPLKMLVGMSFGAMAVDLFFITSGFLIANSLFYRKSLSNFIKARVLRIYPGLVVSLIFCVFVLGAFFTTMPIQRYLTELQTYNFLFFNATLFFGEEAVLPGVFDSLPLKQTVNGSLWTLPFEVRAYALLVMVGVTGSYLNKKWNIFTRKESYLIIPFIGMSIYLFDYFYTILPISYFGSEYARLITLFFIGVAFYHYREKIVLSSKLFGILLFLLMISAIDISSFFVVYNLTLAYLIFYLAYVPKGKVRRFNKYGDYSYGIYIYAFPIQQSIIAITPDISFYNYLLLSTLFTFIFAYFSWHVVEKQALKLKSIKLPLITYLKYKLIDRVWHKTALRKLRIHINKSSEK
jgi:peptidoglycan/LPS O-acetylase OafA/YrhL